MKNACGTGSLCWLQASTGLVGVLVGLLASASALSDGSVWDEAAASAGLQKPVLYAIAICESGHAGQQGATPWPWTLRWAGGSAYFESSEDAAAALESLLAAGFRNIDVGLMQVNWGYHAERFGVDTPARLLDPQVNLRIAATILREAMDAAGGDRAVAVARYHTAEPARGARYAARVLALASLLERDGRVP